jgi:parallel beta-helix repeat protein
MIVEGRLGEEWMHTRITVLFTVVVVAGVLVTPIASAQEESPEGWVITENTKLTEDHSGGIVIGANGITLNCDGHRIVGVSIEGSMGVSLHERTGATVKNCVIEGFHIGVSVVNAHGNTIKGNDLVDNYIAISATGSSHSNVIKGNDVVGVRGIWIEGTEATTPTYGNVVSGNTVSGAEEGFQFRFMVGSKISGNRAIGNHGPGIQLGDWSWGNDIVNNTVVGNAAGITLVTNATSNRVSGNLVRGNESGIAVTDWSTANTISENRIRDNGEGFVAEGESTGNIVKENRFCHNGTDIDPDDGVTNFVQNKFCGPKS